VAFRESPVGFQARPARAALPDRVDDGTTVTRRDRVGRQDGSAVRFHSIEGRGHTWPGAPGRGGKKTHDMEASEEIVDSHTQYGGSS